MVIILVTLDLNWSKSNTPVSIDAIIQFNAGTNAFCKALF